MQSRFELSLGPYYFLLGMFKDHVLGTCMVLAGPKYRNVEVRKIFAYFRLHSFSYIFIAGPNVINKFCTLEIFLLLGIKPGVALMINTFEVVGAQQFSYSITVRFSLDIL